MRPLSLALMFVACAWLACGCSGTRAGGIHETTTTRMLEGPGPKFTFGDEPTAAAPQMYRVGVRDGIRIHVARHPEFSNAVEVDEQGRILIPSTEKPITVSGLDSRQIAKKVAMEIRPYVVRAPEVRVEIVKALSKSYYVVGGVKRPGRYGLGLAPITLRDALLAAGLPGGGTTVEKIKLVKADPVKPKFIELDAAAVMRGSERDNALIHDGDILFVPTATYSKLSRMQVDLELHIENGADMKQVHTFVAEKMLPASFK